jgi:hypothetical protein
MGIGLLLALLVVLFLVYFLPATEKVRITGTEVKRMDAEVAGRTATRDVRYIVTQSVNDGKTLVFRNEDTRWGWPPYLKFNSGDLMGKAVNLQGDQGDAVVLVTYYGWRLSLLDLYPNVLQLELKHRDHVHIPVFNIVVVVLLLAVAVYGYLRFRRLRKWWRHRRQKNSPSVER